MLRRVLRLMLLLYNVMLLVVQLFVVDDVLRSLSLWPQVPVSLILMVVFSLHSVDYVEFVISYVSVSYSCR